MYAVVTLNKSLSQLIMIKLLVFLALSLLLTTTAQANPQEFRAEPKVAILVGISQYNESITGVRPLRYAVNDMKELSKTLKAQNYTVLPIYNASASKSVILHKIRQARELIRPGEGTLLFAFSGHGFSTDNRETNLVTHDTIISSLRETGLSIPEIIREIKSVNPKKAVLFLDACRNAPTPGEKSMTRAGFVNLNPGQGIQLLYSTKQAERSFEEPSFKQGIFSYFLNKGLKGEAVVNGAITFSSLAAYVEREVSDWTYQNKSKVQKPFRSTAGDVAGSFVLAVRGVGNQERDIIVQPRPRPRPDVYIEPGRNQQRTNGYTALIQESHNPSLNSSTGSKVDYCRSYANVAVLQARADLTNSCGFSLQNSNRWSRDAGPQYRWCMTVEPSRTRNEAVTREISLESCF